jgi:tight adherence protein C
MNLAGALSLSSNTVIIAVAALAAFVSVVALWQAAFERDRVAPRLKALASRRDELIHATAARRRGRPRAVKLSLMQQLTRRFSLLSEQAIIASMAKLAPAGWRSRDAAVTYLLARAFAPVVLVVATGIFVFFATHLSHGARLLALIAAVPAGAAAPDIFVRNAADKRRAILQKNLPDGLDLLVICAEAGLSLDASLQRVAREIALSAPLLADEMNITALELGFLPDRRQAIDNLSYRTDTAGIRAVVNTLKQSEKYGTPLGRSLRTLSSEFRDERLMKAEEKAARLPVLMTLPMVAFIMPLLFIVLMGPAFIKIISSLSGIL